MSWAQRKSPDYAVGAFCNEVRVLASKLTLNNNPFMDAPSITDWIQAFGSIASLFVSIIGIALVLRSIKEQNKVNEAQFELLRIESNRAAREVRPVLTIAHLGNGKRRVDYRDHSVSIYELTCAANMARNACIEFLKVGTGSFSKNMHAGNILGQLAVGSKTELLVQHTAMMDNDSVIRIHYQDVDGRFGYDDFAFNLTTVNPTADKRHTEYPGINKIAYWVSSYTEVLNLYPDPPLRKTV